MGRKYTAGIRTRVRTAVGPLFEMLHIYMVLARLCKTHTYPVWGMTMLRQIRSNLSGVTVFRVLLHDDDDQLGDDHAG